jgi:hypothetical protein
MLEQNPQTTLAAIRTPMCEEKAIEIQPTIAGIPENNIVCLGPNLSPQKPPTRQPKICPRFILLAETTPKISNS